MDNARIVVIIESVKDGTIGIEQVWQTYGDLIRSTKNVETEREAVALTALYSRYGNYLANRGYFKDAIEYYERAINVLDAEKKVVSDKQYDGATETILYSLANVHAKLENYKDALPYLKQLKDRFPRKDKYRQAYIGCLRSLIAKFTMPIYIVLGLLFLIKIGEIHLFHTHYIPGWLIDVAWVIWIVALIVQFCVPWVMKKLMK